MASPWAVKSQPRCSYSPPAVSPKPLPPKRIRPSKSELALLVKKALLALGMSRSSGGSSSSSSSSGGGQQFSISHQSRILLAAMRTQLAMALEERELTAAHTAASPSSYSAIVSCNSCGGFMVQPVCMPCGHSVCKACTEKSTMASGDNLICPKCNHTFPKIPKASDSISGWREEGATSNGASGATVVGTEGRQHRVPTLTLQNAFRKWYPRWVESCQYREEGNKFANQKEFESAVQWYTQALGTGVCDFRVLGNRSCSYLGLGQLEKAREDAELACRLHPFWAKGHYRRAAVLERQGHWREAMAAYLLCLHLGSNDQAVLKTACQLLDKHMSREALSEIIGSELTPDSTADSNGLQSSVPSEEPHAASSTPSARPPGSPAPTTIVDLGVGVMGACLEVAEAMKAELSALVAPADPSLVDLIDFECVLCTGLLYDPVTTLCGHSFCRSCLCRSFDHSPTCPICRLLLVEDFQQHCQNMGKIGLDTTLEAILLHYFPDAYMEKKALVTAETEKNLVVGTSELQSLPVFVCTMAYPGLPCPLHIFEPRYRLMIRRCMESGSRRFGMCQPAAPQEGSAVSFTNFGTVLHISSVESMEDGRFLISTRGERRFKVLERGMIDGYHTAKIMFLFDERVTDQDEIASLRALQQETYDTAKKWLYEAPFFSRIMMMQVVTTPLPDVDPVPECCPNGPEWVWWFVHALPTTPTKKLDFLKCTSLRERLLLLKELLTHPILNT